MVTAAPTEGPIEGCYWVPVWDCSSKDKSTCRYNFHREMQIPYGRDSPHRWQVKAVPIWAIRDSRSLMEQSQQNRDNPGPSLRQHPGAPYRICYRAGHTLGRRTPMGTAIGWSTRQGQGPP